jgi:myo-inositol 2-dehydrogenase / D-chiro-inositol 1-dehydrogenase
MSLSKQDAKISIAVAGLGRMGKRHVHTLLNRVPNTHVVAVCSSTPAELTWAHSEYTNWGIDVYDSYSDMISHPGLQAVWVSTSTDVHASQTIEVIERGLNVLCEKPLGTDMEEVRGSLYFATVIFDIENIRILRLEAHVETVKVRTQEEQEQRFRLTC